MIITIFSLGLLILFCYTFATVLRSYKNELDGNSRAAAAEKAMAARFIKNAMSQYTARHRTPSMDALTEMEELISESDDLVEQYWQLLKANQTTNNDNVSMMPIMKKAL
ncbi:MAG: hypothetical protein CVV11_19975 [Gammaproteobacteria bacterium HGW-Gammaproteobacteria-15]|nr:MAG: hypothetical protein CVV11_19975 [Gammaproteobacteria bacterium HGW-Gammaproteobacteria-15]